MKKNFDIQSDGTNVYITSSVHTSNGAKLLLTIANIGILLLHAFFIFEIEKHEIKKLVIPTFISLLVFIYFPWRYWLWKFYGKEYIVINRNTLTYSYDYGLFKTKAQSVSHSNLNISYESVKQVNNEDHGNLDFSSDDPKTKGREYIHETTVLIPGTEVNTINSHLSKILNSDQQANFA